MITLDLTVMTRPFGTRRQQTHGAEGGTGSSAAAGFDGFPFPRSLRHQEAAKRDRRRSSWWAGHQMSCFR